MATNSVIKDHHTLRRNLKLNNKYISNDGGNEGILVGDAGIVTVSSALSIKESSSAVDHLDTYGRLWVNNTDPTALYFTNDDGDDIQLTSGDSAIGTISLAADRITVGDAQVNLATSSGNIVFKSNGNSGTDEFLTLNTSDTSDASSVPVTEIMGKDDQRLRIRCRGDTEDLQLFSERNVEIAIANVTAGEGGGVQMWKDLTPTVAEKTLEATWVADQDELDFDLLQVLDQDNTSIPAQLRGSTSGTRCILKYSTDGSGNLSISAGIREPGHGYANTFTDSTCDYNTTNGLLANGDVASGTLVVNRATICHDEQTIAKVVFMSVEGIGIPTGAYIGEVVSSTCFRIHLDGGTGAIDIADREAVTVTETNSTLTFRDRVCFLDAHGDGTKHCVLEVEEAGQGNIIIGQANAAAQGQGKLQNIRGMIQFDSNIVSTGMAIRAVNGDLFLQSRSAITAFGEDNKNRLKMDGNDSERRLFIAASDINNLNIGSNGSWTGAGGLEIAVVKTSGHTTYETHGTTSADMDFISAGTIKLQPEATGTSKVDLEKTVTSTTANTYLALDIDYNKSGASSSDNTLKGINIDMDNTTATNGTNTMYGIYCTPTLIHAADAGTATVVGTYIKATGSSNGTSKTIGLDIDVSGADLNYPIITSGGRIGFGVDDPDVALEIMHASIEQLKLSYDNDSYATIAVNSTSNLTMTSAQAGNIKLDAAGDIILDADGANITLQDGGSTYTPTTASDAVTKAYADANIYHFIRIGFNYSYTGGTKVYLPIPGAESLRESTTIIAASETVCFLCPYDGSLEKIIVRSEEVCGSTVIGLHVGAGTIIEVPSATAAQSVTVDMAVDDTGYTFDFAAAGTNTFSAGNFLAFSFDPTNDANDTHLIIVLKFDVSP